MTYKLNVAQPIVERDGTMANAFRQYTQDAALSIPITGTGTPEGNVAVSYTHLTLPTIYSV